MPELPEVETTRRILEPLLLGQRVLRILHQDPTRYRRTGWAEGRRVENLRRRGKFLILGLEGGMEAVVHLGMSGGFRFTPDPHTRLVLSLPGQNLYYTDPRRFGRWWVVRAGEYQEIGLLGRMGPEPLSPGFTLGGFQASLGQTRRRIKEVLLGQEAVAGLGNIYADEALWQSRIHPQRPAHTLDPAEVRRLYRAIRLVLKQAVAAGGSTLMDQSYRQPDGRPGYFQLQHKAYNRTGQPCLRRGCGGQIVRITVGGRGTHLCPRCQPPQP
ncbi:Formamidopyrimidine-DNA glycosylase [Meiothermus luteus]|jgi:formamidopyrimidine-DNA glycosylase|uniref:Formamidopyrimidine-DNA glycosylase n=1 Tax=Meiothermus luteus TaxID=2026184 RepID=A0A399EJ32_9DEIN|nr:DNA-formamidopyrimidine glycosylase [Meiothermus luteus]RIH84734.1 Formamidopyrimidine-DNA glycosylase [Meiothermus luteus]RMH58078.1 MAG: DNA-formamidopyrimidine glycosylase [Deinococcota bacterium]